MCKSKTGDNDVDISYISCPIPLSVFSERLIMQMCDKMVTDGLRDAGYTYISIDDCWSERERDPVSGRLVADRKRFPSGIKALADYVGCHHVQTYVTCSKNLHHSQYKPVSLTV